MSDVVRGNLFKEPKRRVTCNISCYEIVFAVIIRSLTEDFINRRPMTGSDKAMVRLGVATRVDSFMP